MSEQNGNEWGEIFREARERLAWVNAVAHNR